MSGFGVVVAALAIAAERVTGSGALGTFALALEFFARACAAVPAARAAARRGRRAVLLLGAACGVVGSLLVALDMFLKSYVVRRRRLRRRRRERRRAAGAFRRRRRRRRRRQTTRALRLRRGRRGGGVRGARAREGVANMAPGVGVRRVLLGDGAVLRVLRRLRRRDAKRGTRRCLFATRRGRGGFSRREDLSFETFKSASANARKGTACVAIAWPLMFLVMSAAPLAMMGAKEGGHGFDETADAIRAHLLAMFAPGALGTGDLVRRAGPDVVAHVGCGLFVACAVFSNAFVPVTAADDVGGGGRVPYWAYRDGLVVLGLAWHLVFVAGSAALSDESAKTQGACESLAFALVAVCASTSGAILQRMGWRALNAFAAASAALSLYLLRERFLSASEKKKTRKDADAADPGAPASAA